jgi:rhodanese-related sulfurtransferase
MVITKKQLRDRISGNKAVVLNVLPRNEFEKLHIEGSHPMPLEKNPILFVQEVKRLYAKGTFFITYGRNPACELGVRAAQILREQGFKAEPFLGGLEEWNCAGLPVQGYLAQGARFTTAIGAPKQLEGFRGLMGESRLRGYQVKAV